MRIARRRRSDRPYLSADAPRLDAGEPCYVELPSGRRLLELPTTHSLGMLARGILRPYGESIVHAYFHDTDLADSFRRTALVAALAILGRKRRQTDLTAIQRGARPVKTMSFANSRG